MSLRPILHRLIPVTRSGLPVSIKGRTTKLDEESLIVTRGLVVAEHTDIVSMPR
jgi:hypothetical protein